MSRESGSEECHEKEEFAQDGKEDHVDEKEEPNSDELVNGKEEPSHDELMNGTQERSPDVLMNGTHEPSPDELFDGEEDPSIDELVYGDDPSFDEVIYEEEDPNPNELVCEEEGASLDELVCEEEDASLDELVCEEEGASLDELVCEEEDPHADELICEEEDPIPDELMCDEEDAIEEEDASPEELICDEEYPNADELICEEEDPNSDDLICEEEDPNPDDLICEEEIPHPDEDDFICEEEDPNPIDLICEEEDPSFRELICGEQDPSLHELFDGRDEPRPNARENPSPDGREDPRPDGREDPNLDARQDPSAGELFDGQNDQSPSEHTKRKGERSPDGKEDQWNGKEEENMKRVNESRKEQNGNSSTESSRSRKRKADVAVFLLDPDEVLAKRETIGRTAVRIPAFLRNPWSVILTPDKGWDEPSLPNSNMPIHNFSQHRATPLPLLGWANRDEVWKIMLSKEQVYLRDKNFMERHPSLQPRMRSILLDWMMEVSEVYKLHRETYYLAQDFFDRYMATQRNITKTLLQLIGITSLFIAAKLEEIYPPKLYQFAYVTDGACTEEEILTMELIIMKALKWRLSPMTLVSWLNVYMQVAYLNDLYEEVLMPQYPQQIFVQVAELLDVCILDMGCFDFTYGVLAASALYHFSSTEIMKKVSGFDWPEVEECVKWMVPFAMAVKEVGGARLKYFKGVPSEDMHNIQTHVNTINLLDKAYEKQAMLADERVSVPTGLLTPPPSDKKPTSKEQE